MTPRILTLLALCACVSGLAQTEAPLAVKPIRGGVYYVTGGSGAATGFIVGSKEVVVIDSKMTAESAKAVLAEIAKVTKNPVKYVVLTHGDGDHVNGLSGFPQGLTIVAHANTKKDMEEAFQDPKMSALLPYLPNRTVSASGPLAVEGARIELLYFGPAHTTGDLVVFLPDQKIAFIGDLVFIGRDPLIHRQKGGTSIGAVETLKKILALDAETFLAGHAGPLTKAEVRGALTSLQEKQAKVKSLVQQGKSLAETKAAMGVPNSPGERFPSLVEIIYLEQTAKK